jgi:hypothetical protein
MTKKMNLIFLIFFCLLCRLAYAQTDSLKIIGASAEIGTEDNLVELYLKNDIPIRGIQLTLSHSADLLPIEVLQTVRTLGFNVEYSIPTPGQMTILIYRFSSGSITADKGSIVDIKFTVSQNAQPGDFPLELQNVYASDLNGQSVTLKLNDGVFTIEDATPVELVNFYASFIKNNHTIKLEWRTSSESNNYGFEIQRGENDINFHKIGFINGQGTTSSFHKYHFIDVNFFSGTNYYRLKQIDFDGSTSYSDVIKIIALSLSTYKLYQNYPNPFNPETTIEFDLPLPGFVEIIIYDIKGKLVRKLVSEQKQPGNQQVKWDATDENGVRVSNGTYFYNFKSGLYSQTKKMILIK